MEKDKNPLALGHLSQEQLRNMLIFLWSAKALGMAPTVTIMKVGSSAWISQAISTVLGLFALLGWIKWGQIRQDSSLITSFHQTLGKPLGDILSLLLILLMTIGGALSVRIFAGGAIIGLLPAFPIEILIFMLVFPAAYVGWLGLEAVGRWASFFFWPTALTLLFILIGVNKMLSLGNLCPIWGLGFKETMESGLLDVGLYGTIPAAMALRPYVRDYRDFKKSGYTAIAISGLVLMFTSALVSMVFPYPMGPRKIEPMGVIARAAYLGRFVQRVEALFAFTWFFIFAIQASTVFLIVFILAQDFTDSGSIRPLAPGFASLTLGIAFLPDDTLAATNLLGKFVFGIPGRTLALLGWFLFFMEKLKRRKVPKGEA